MTVQGQQLHERVHNDDLCVVNKVITAKSLPVRSLKLGLYGVVDLVEFVPDDVNGISISNIPGLFSINLVEYKRGKPKISDCDKVQLCAQVMCLEEMFLCSIHTSQFYYGETHHRDTVNIDDDIREKVHNICVDMRAIYESGITPESVYTTTCKNCSLYDICQPKTIKKSANKYWINILKDSGD